MIVNKVELVCVTDRKEFYPKDNLPEIAFTGRSNVGKSSLINLLLGRKIAKVSGTPGKTRTINFYQINDEFRIVDLPGYGYAKASKKVIDAFAPMIEQYLKERENLAKLIQLVDIRHLPTEKDKQMAEWARYYDCLGPIVATKADKLSKSRANESIRNIKTSLKMGENEKVLPVSALKRTGVDALKSEINNILIDFRKREIK